MEWLSAYSSPPPPSPPPPVLLVISGDGAGLDWGDFYTKKFEVYGGVVIDRKKGEKENENLKWGEK